MVLVGLAALCGSLLHVSSPAQAHAQQKLNLEVLSPIGSVYGNYQGMYDWRDGLDNNAPALKGATNDVPGIALPDRATLGHWYYVLAPNGKAQILQQTDIGPAARTKRGIDVNAAAAEKFGYSPNDFPTDRPFRVALLTDRRPDCLLS